MYVERTAQGVTIRLSTDEARCLRSDLDLIPTKQSGNPEFFAKLQARFRSDRSRQRLNRQCGRCDPGDGL